MGCQNPENKCIHCIPTPILHALKEKYNPCRIQVLQDGDLIEEFIKMLIFLFVFYVSFGLKMCCSYKGTFLHYLTLILNTFDSAALISLIALE